MESIILCRWEVWTCQKNPCDKACQSSMVGRLVCWGSIILLCFEILKPIGWTKLSVSESLKNEILCLFLWTEVFFYLIRLLFFCSLKDWKLLPEFNYNKRWGMWIWHCVGLNVLLLWHASKGFSFFFLGGGGIYLFLLLFFYDWWWEANYILCMHA